MMPFVGKRCKTRAIFDYFCVGGMILYMKKFMSALMLAMFMCGCSSREEHELDALFRGIFPEGEPGAAVLIMKGDRVVFEHGYGLADLQTGDAVTGDTFFNIASCSKQFTAVAVLQLAQAGLLSLDDRVSAFFPELTAPIWDDVRIWHLLSHSSGVPDKRGYLTREEKISGDENLATEYLLNLDRLNFAPGTGYEYINPTFVLLGRLVERVSGQEFTTYVHDHIFVPAGMGESLYFDRDRQDLIPRMAHGYEYDDVSSMPEERTAGTSEGPKEWYEYDFGEETFFATRPDGGIYTSVREFVSWEKALREGSVLDREWLEQAWTPRTRVSGSVYSEYQNRPGTWYGYGWFIEPRNDVLGPVIYHTGDNGGFKILAARYPKSDALVLVFANRADWDRHGVKTAIEKISSL